MKRIVLTGFAAALGFAVAQAQQPGAPGNAQPTTTTLVSNNSGPVQYIQQPATTAPGVYVYDQHPLQQPPALVSQADAQATVDAFRTNYQKLGSPRILIYINRTLVDQQSGMKLTGRSENVTTTTKTDSNAISNSVTTETVAKNNYSNGTSNVPTLADRQTVRDVERLMGRPLRAAGATLVDQRVAEQLMENRPLDSLAGESEQARKDRASVNQIADVVLEVLVSSRAVTVPGFSSDHTYNVPDIQVTAIRLKDAKVIGQASATDVINHAGGPVVAARNFSVQDITEATGLALMGDMLQETK